MLSSNMTSLNAFIIYLIQDPPTSVFLASLSVNRLQQCISINKFTITLVISSVLYPDKIHMGFKTLSFTLLCVSVGQITNLIAVHLCFPSYSPERGNDVPEAVTAKNATRKITDAL